MTRNPIQNVVQMLNMGRNPMSMLQQMARTDPQMAQFMQMINGKSQEQLQQMASNMAKEQGISINDIIRQLGITVPSGR